MHENRSRTAQQGPAARPARVQEVRHQSSPAEWEILLPPAVLMAVAVIVVVASPSQSVRVTAVVLSAAVGVAWLLLRLRARHRDRVRPTATIPEQQERHGAPLWWSDLGAEPILEVGRGPRSGPTPAVPVSRGVQASPGIDLDADTDSAGPPLVLSAPARDPRQAPPPRVNQGWIQLNRSPGADDACEWRLRLDDGREVGLGIPVLLGRNPQRTQGDPEVNIVPSGGDGRMISRTHVLIEAADDGVWIVDRGSTNGTALVARGGELEDCPAGIRVRVDDGQQVAYGNRWFTICRRD